MRPSSDRGSQYTSYRFQQILHEHAVVQSFSNSGKPHDNAVAESFLRLSKRKSFTEMPLNRKSEKG